MRAIFIFVVMLVLIALAVPATFAVNVWLDGRAVIMRAEQSGALRPPSAGRLNVVERTVAMNEFRETWRASALPCRTIAYLWADLTNESAPNEVAVSNRLATELMGERRERSVRWQVRRFVVACQLEQRFDDRQLLRLWLDRAYFGQQPPGLEIAAQTYFGKPSRALNSNESARLAALLRGPGLRTRPEAWTERARLIEERVAPQ